jgi:hypothetical protein
MSTHLTRIFAPAAPESKQATRPRRHHGKRAPKGASEETGSVDRSRVKMQLPKRRELAKPNV